MPGGKMDFGDKPHEGAHREVLEETGVSVDKEKLKLISVTNEIVPDAHYVTLGFLCENFEGEPSVMEPDEITEWRWFDMHNLPEPMFPPCVKIVKNYLDKEVYKH